MHSEMNPAPGSTLVRHAGDRLRFALAAIEGHPRAFLRTNLGRASILREEILQALPAPSSATRPQFAPPGLAWRDIPMAAGKSGWELDLTLSEPGFFQAKAYSVDRQGRQVWPAGPDASISVHPSEYRAGNIIYCAFTRLFGETKSAEQNALDADPLIARLDKQHYAVIPPSGKFRDLLRELPHIFDTLGCRILHLLPIHPTPTTYARFGRYGSPYACGDFLAVDPALVEFDRRTTGLDQFQELASAVHRAGGKLILDIVINHTGWGSPLQENHPDWFLRKENGTFVSPGAWGTIWEDLVEIDHRVPWAWDHLADVFITWCRRGVDGFRCDAGYKVPTAAWRHISAKLRREFPNSLLLLEGLGGAWEATAELLTLGGMQWAYSELFQNYSPIQVSGYLDHALRQHESAGTLVHYSETHDNPRLAAQPPDGRVWSLLRNQLCALTSANGAFGYACGVEWLAKERINVHSCRSLSWGNPNNIIPELARLGALLREHPCFLDGAKLRRVSGADSTVYALDRLSADGADRLLVLVNLDPAEPSSFVIEAKLLIELGQPDFDLLAGHRVATVERGGMVEIRLRPGQSLCLASSPEPRGMAGTEYRRRRAQHAWAISALAQHLEPEHIGPHSWTALAEFAAANPKSFLALLPALDPQLAAADLLAALTSAAAAQPFSRVVEWSPSDARKTTPIPPDHWLLLSHSAPFRATLAAAGIANHADPAPSSEPLEHAESVELNGLHWAAFPPHTSTLAFRKIPRLGSFSLRFDAFSASLQITTAPLLFLPASACHEPAASLPLHPRGSDPASPIVLLANGRGGMARLCVDLGEVKSKYDCVLGANLHPSLPVDRHIFAKRLRAWADASGFITPLNAANLAAFHPGPPARWQFAAIAGDGRTVSIEMLADLLEGQNTTVFCFRQLAPTHPAIPVRLILRLDLEDRNFHTETRHSGAADHHFNAHLRPLRKTAEPAGFAFTPAPDRELRAYVDAGAYHPEPEWSHNLPHSVEATRGQPAQGDAFSPGWFEIPLSSSEPARLIVTSEPTDPSHSLLARFAEDRRAANARALQKATLEKAALIDSADSSHSFPQQLALATRAFLARRDQFKTVIAGYPWFLDWGRDSLICARGLISAGLLDEVRELLITFARFEKDGTLPNTIHGADASNRDTSDAPLWFGVVCAELAARTSAALYDTPVDTPADAPARTLRDVLRSIASGCARGTPNGIRLDPASGLLWSPSHFTWMDTNYPAGTPREGYPVEIQALWIQLLEQLHRLQAPSSENFEPWDLLAARARKSLEEFYWLEDHGWFADVLLAPRGQTLTPAAQAIPDDALRSNCALPIAFGLLPQAKARRCIENVFRHLAIPGALRSLAPLPVRQPLPIHGPDWRLLNDPHQPYSGRYHGDEDTQRKPAYHNGTAWVFTLPPACEALARAWDFSPHALAAARSYLASIAPLLSQGCLGHLPEILDGDTPHAQRGCDAQAWSVTEALRVWKLLH